MSSTTRGWIAAAALGTLLAGSQLIPAAAQADPEVQPDPGIPAPPEIAPQSEVTPQGEDGLLHNIVYRARVDGVSRGATITYAAEGDQTQTANPTMVPGREFEANTVLPASKQATMRVSIEWPYSANLACEILVDDALVAQAEDFIAPRFMPVKDDPDYGALTCEAPVSGIPNVVPADPAAPPADPAAPIDTTQGDASVPPPA